MGAFSWLVLGSTRSFDLRGNTATGIINAVKTFAAVPFVSEKKLSGEDNLRVNALILGESGPGYESPLLTDTILVASINTQTKELALISIPRDLLIQIPGSKLVSRINTLYLMKKQADEMASIDDFNKHAEYIKSKVEEITGLEIPYVVLINVSGFESAIEALGGINVYVDHDIVDPQFPTTGYGHEYFSLEKGWRFMDGATAQKYVRTRHDIRGDFGRMERQQQVVGAIINKARGLNLILDFSKIFSLVSTLGNNIQTNADTGEIKRTWSFSKNIDVNKIKNLAIDGGRPDSLLTDYRPYLGTGVASTLVPRAGIFNYSEIQNAISSLLR